jgi:hypothetical protein
MKNGMDLLEWQRDALEKEGLSPEKTVSFLAKKLRVLRFKANPRGDGSVSQIQDTIVFIDPKFYGPPVMPGDVWLCSTEYTGTVYNATPLMRIDPSMLFGLSDEIRGEIIEILWRKNRSAFISQFEEMYKEEIYSRAREETANEYDATIARLNDELLEMKRQLEMSRMVHSAPVDEGIELTSEADKPIDQPQAFRCDQQPAAPPMFGSNYIQAPGIPEIRVQMQPGNHYYRPVERFSAEIVSPDTIRIDGLADGQYFVHMSPSKMYLVVRKHSYGSAVCKNGMIQLAGLENFSSFSGRRPLTAEYSPKYDGILVFL